MDGFFKSRIASIHHAFSGIIYIVRTQKNTWIYMLITFLVIFLGLWLALPSISWAITALTIILVWSMEAINTSIETIVDLVQPENHPLAKIIKDVSAAAVLTSAIGSVFVGIFVFGPPLLGKILSDWR